MDHKAFRKYMKQNPQFKEWVRTNGEWFTAHPEAIKQMLDHPEVLASFNQALLKKKATLYKRIQKLEAKQQNNPKKAGTVKSATQAKPKKSIGLKLPSLSTMNHRLMQAAQMMEGIHSLMGNLK
jgi:hypothetical protein